MSAGLHFLAACARQPEPARRIFRKAPRHLFTEAELGHYDFAQGYLDQYASYPPLEAFAQQRKALTDFNSTQTLEALLGRLYFRKAHDGVASRYGTLKSLVESRDMEAVEVVLRDMLTDVTGSRVGTNYVALDEHIPDVLAGIERARSHRGLFGASMGWEPIDQATMGIAPGELAFIVGRPGAGKSWELLRAARENRRLGHRTLVVSMEMGLDQITRRLLALETGINPNVMRTGQTSVHETQRLRQAQEALSDGPKMSLVSGDLNKDVAGIEALVQELAPDVVLIDALYLLRSSTAGNVKSWEALEGVIRALKRCALSSHIPIIGSVQFNRNQRQSGGGGNGTRGSKEMDLADIAGSDAIPQDASVVVGVRQWPPPHHQERYDVKVLKNREGSTASFVAQRKFEPRVEFSILNEEDLAMPTEAPTGWRI